MNSESASRESAGISIELRPLDNENFLEVLLLRVKEQQRRFIADNFKSFAQAHFDPDAWLRAIYCDNTPVGLVLLTIEKEEYETLQCLGQPYLWRLMIAEAYQRKGIGKATMQQVIEEVSKWPEAKDLYLSVVEENKSARKFYLELGFQDLNLVLEGERVMKFSLH